jgi:hypothetical protein
MSGTVAWIVPTEAGTKNYLAAAGITSFGSSALGSGQSNPFTSVMPAVVAEIRAYVASCSRNVLSETANSVPPELEHITYLLLIQAMQGRLPGINLTKVQEDDIKAGRAMLDKVAKCEIAVGAPTDPAASTVQTGAAAVVVTSSTRIVSREYLRGLR